MPYPASKSKLWIVQPPRPELCRELSVGLQVSQFLAQLLINRGINTVKQGQSFLNAGLESLHDPFLMKGMAAAVQRLEIAVSQGEKICVYGDYDADGITGTILLCRMLTQLGAPYMVYIPHRLQEGYGLNSAAVRNIHAQGVRLLITVDCGISNPAEVELAQGLGMDVIVTDHHQPPPVLPPAAVILNPKRPDCTYPYKDLAGVGVAAKLAQAVSGKFNLKNSLSDNLDLICLGTVADVSPLTGENRIFVKYGLQRLTNASNLGIRKIKQVAGMAGDAPVQVGDIEYKLAPRINAAGRLGSSMAVLRLLLTDSEGEADELARMLDEENRRRKQLEDGILKQAQALSSAQFDPARDRALVLQHPEWHPGVLGIVASKMAEVYNLPCILLCTKDDPARGSARSVDGFYIHQALDKLRAYLVTFGGHHYAAGLTIRHENINPFRDSLNALAWESIGSQDLPDKLNLDGRLSLDDLDKTVISDIALLHPFGVDNSEPLFWSDGLQVMYPRGVGTNHLKLKLRQQEKVIDGIGFSMGELLEEVDYCSRNGIGISAAFQPQINSWQGQETLQLKLQDIRFAEKMTEDKKRRG
ncbi:single-stranded-DNA-specific exonuclease RecJ [candidate division TA06 bacterium]|nr:single-stranded-DNA-specific exonuclease RecJ [candidate division TA06 bacterium]